MLIRPLAALLLFALLPMEQAPARVPTPPAAEGGIVSAADPRAAAAGVEILRAGGSATDAAIAMMLALNVVEPQSSGISGGGFLLHYDAKSGTTDSFDGREAAPAAADAHWFYAPDGTPLSHSAAIPGGRSVGVPGNLAMMALAHHMHGRLPWARLFQPAIRLARDGVAITPRLHEELARYGAHITGWGRTQYFEADGVTPKPVGTILRNPELADLFGQIAAKGPAYFYAGPPAAKLVATVDGAELHPSKMSFADLANYHAKDRPPVCGTYRVWRVCGMGPPSSGGWTVLAILKLLERFDLGKLGKDSPVAWHLIAEAERLAYADRDMYLADSDFVSVPLAGLSDPAYLAARSALISPDRTMASVAPGDPAGAPPRIKVAPRETPGTTHMAVADAQGDIAEVTSTIEGPFGSGLTMDGLFLNNELTDFDIVPDKDGYLVANRVEGGKRPRSSMAPTIVYGPDGAVRIAIGAAGGATIIAQVAKALIGVLDWHLSAQQAIALPLIFAPGPTAYVEQGTSLEAMVPALEALGQQVKILPMGLKANAIERVNGHWVGAADPRSEGVAMAEDGTITRPPPAAVPAGAPSE